MDRTDIIDDLRAYGAVDDDVLTFDGALGAQHIDHLDLHPDGSRGGRSLGVDAVVRPNGRVLLYVVRGRPDPARQNEIAGRLAQRGEGEFVGFLQPGSLLVVPTAPQHRESRITHTSKDASARSVIPGLTFGTSDLTVEGADAVLHRGLLELFNESVDHLTQVEVAPQDALSLVGRAMFFRFLIDKGFVQEQEAPAIAGGARSLANAMATATATRSTMRWLKRTFNGHLLPLTDDVSERIASPDEGEAIREQLTRILTRTAARGQLSFAWDQLDFAHLPVGLLSEVYEDWAHTYEGKRAKREGAWYTPAAIAQGIVREALAGVAAPWSAHVLDPSAGAGVFLVAAYRGLVRATWEHEKKRPSRTTVRRILREQLVGMEVNEAALRLSALALYLTALDLDPEPGPTARIPFPNLLEEGVLRDVRCKADFARIRREEAPVGSLGDHVDASLDGRFSVVVGNPPWTPWKVSERTVAAAVKEVEAVVAPIVSARVGGDVSYVMSGGNPDLPFLWRAMRWAVPDGVVAFALHGRWLFQQTDQAIDRRSEVLRGLTVSTIVNGTALRRKEGVWAGQEAPFFILFARNRRPAEEECFRFLSPVEDDALNARGRIRLDASAAFPVSPTEAIEKPWLFKALFRGGPLDRAVVEKVLAATRGESLASWWHPDFSGRGYENASAGGGASAINMQKHLALAADTDVRVRVLDAGGPLFTAPKVRRPTLESWREEHPNEVQAGLAPRMFRGPLVIARKVPRAVDQNSGGLAMWARRDVVYSQSFLGFSAAWHSDPVSLSRYLLVWLNSSVLRHFLLMCSADWGVERGTLLVDDLRSLPVPRPESLSAAAREAFNTCADAMIAADRVDVARCDQLVADVLRAVER